MYTSHELNLDLNNIAKKISEYLMPGILYIGLSKERIKLIQQSFRWADHLQFHNDTSFKLAEIIIYDAEIIDTKRFIWIKENLRKNQAIIFAHKSYPIDSSIFELDWIHQNLCISLYNPTFEMITSHIRALLLLKESVISLQSKASPLVSLNKSYIEQLETIINSIGVNQSTIVIECVDIDHGQAINQYLTNGMKNEIAPIFIKKITDLSKNILKTKGHYKILIFPTKELIQSIREHYANDNVDYLSQFLIFTKEPKQFIDLIPNNSCNLTLLDINNRQEDAFLISYLISMRCSHEINGPIFLSNQDIAELLTEKDLTITTFYLRAEQLIKRQQSNWLPESKGEFINLNERLALTPILSTLEINVWKHLYERGKTIPAMEQATGISKATYHKRINRLVEKVGILSNNKFDL